MSSYAVILGGTMLAIGLVGMALAASPVLEPEQKTLKVTGVAKDQAVLMVRNYSVTPVEIVDQPCGCGTEYRFPEGLKVPPFGTKKVIVTVDGSRMTHGTRWERYTVPIKSHQGIKQLETYLRVEVDRRAH
ncbi:MAG: hypothetical protein SFX74_01215 [Fimbriimonadaceae bacterium]|nr:hypothetical protein [Fimbriimonadaceae bacterium]